MSSHSEEIWDSFDALWRQMQALSRRVRELEARLAPDLAKQGEGVVEPRGASFKESNNADFVYEGDLK
jgi:hypothetical protein